MNNKEIYINGILVDLDEANNPIELVYAVNDLAELKDRQAYSTNTFKLPDTSINRAAFGFPADANLVQLQPYRKNTAKIVQNGIEIIPNGIAVITKVSKAIEVQILSGLIGFFDQLGDKNIRDLDLSQYDHQWTLQTVVNSQNNTEGYVYPIIDYGGLDDIKREADATQLRPATFRKTVIDAIVQESGYTVLGSVMELEKYKTSLIPFTNDKFEHGDSFINAPNSITASARKTVSQTLSNDQRDFIISFQDDVTTDPGNHWNGTEYTSANVAKVHVKLLYNIDIRDQYKGGSTPSIFVYIQVYRAGAWTSVSYTQHMSEGDFKSTLYLDQPLEADIDLLPGDKIRVAAHSEPATDRILGIIQAGASISIEYVPGDVIYGQPIQLAATLPDISQKNFFKDFLQNFGLIAVPDSNKKTLQLINMGDVYANKDIADDITDKLFNSVDDIGYSLGNYGVNNYAKYKKDDAVPEGEGDGILVLDNLTLDETVQMFTSVFAASTSSIKMSGLNVTQIKKIEDVTKSADFNIKTEPRILLDRKVNTQFTIKDGDSSQIIQLISLPTFDGLDYKTLIKENYHEIRKMLYRPFTVEKQILLSEIDVANIDWTIPVYDRNSASYYYKNQIRYVQGDISTISLVKLCDPELPVNKPTAPVIMLPPDSDPGLPYIPVEPPIQIPTPKTLMAKFSFSTGVAIKESLYDSRPVYKNLADTQYDRWTSENACKMGRIVKSDLSIDWTSPDNFMNKCKAAGKKALLHCVVWANEMPDVLAAKIGVWSTAEWTTWLTNYVTAYLDRYLNNPTWAGIVTMVDLINEPLANSGALKSSQWKTALPNFIDVAFAAAQPFANKALFGVNDFDFEYTNSKAEGMIALRDSLAAQGSIMHYVGSQNHSVARVDFSILRSHLKKLSDAGLKVHISELDVAIKNGSNPKVAVAQWTGTPTPETFTSSPTLQQIHRDFFVGTYRAYIDSVADENKVGITQWSVSDRDNSRNADPNPFSDFPTMWNYDYTVKSLTFSALMGMTV